MKIDYHSIRKHGQQNIKILTEIHLYCSRKTFKSDSNFVPDTLIHLVRFTWVVRVHVSQQNVVAHRQVRRPGWPGNVTQDVIFQTTSGSRAVSVVAPSCWHQVSKLLSWASSSDVSSSAWCRTDVIVTFKTATLTLIVLTWRIGWAHNNARK